MLGRTQAGPPEPAPQVSQRKTIVPVPKPPTRVRTRAIRAGAALLLAVLALNVTGCRYLKHRGEDLLETFDVGFTFSRSPQLCLYANGASFICFGYSKFDGKLVGMGGGFFGIIDHRNDCRGYGMYGREYLYWHKKNKTSKRYKQVQGLYAIMGGKRFPPPAYFPACVHNFHIGWIGIVFNLRYAEMLDFILGFTTFDLAGDDNRTIGDWFFY